MKKNIIIIGLLMGLAAMGFKAHAGLEWRLVDQMDLEIQPKDIAVSEDGKLIFIVSSGEILVYSPANRRIENRIPIGEDFDRVTYSGKTNSLIVTGTRTKKLSVIQLEEVHNVDISGLPVKGPADAPVIIAVFDDYQ